MPALFAVKVTSDPLGIQGSTAGDVLTGGLQTNPQLNKNEDGAAYIEAPTPQDAVRQAIAGSITAVVSGIPTVYTFNPSTVSMTAVDHPTFLLDRDGPGSGTPPNSPSTDWTLNLEDLTNFPNISDWDYNDRYWHINAKQLPAEEVVPDLKILDASGSAMDVHGLRVSKFENAFEHEKDGAGAKIPLAIKPGYKTKLKSEFIDLDPDRFYAQVADAKANTNPNLKETVRVALETQGEVPGNSRWVTLTETGNDTGVFKSKSLLLVEDVQDDTYKVDGVTDNDLDDRTLLANPRSFKESISPLNKPKGYMIDGVWPRYPYRVPTDPPGKLREVRPFARLAIGGTATQTGIVNLHVTILKMANGTAVITKEAVKEMIRAANRVYAPVGIHFQLSGPIEEIAQPQGVKMERDPNNPQLDPGGVELGTFPVQIGGNDEGWKVASSNRSADTDDIEVYFVNALSLVQVGAFPRGVSAPASIVPRSAGVPDGRYRDTVLMSASGFQTPQGITKAGVYDLAHEFGHILTDDFHYGAVGRWEVNLMRDDPSTTRESIHLDSKRWTQVQQDTMFTAWPKLTDRKYDHSNLID